MNRDQVQSWLDRYVGAWRGRDPAAIGALFSDDAAYRHTPWMEPIRGRDAIVAYWLMDPNPAGSFEARYEPVAVDGEAAVAMGVTKYSESAADGFAGEYANIFVLRFDDAGACREYTEWWMQRRRPPPG